MTRTTPKEQNLLLTIQGLMPTMSSAEKRIADLVVRRSKLAISSTISRLAAETDTSYATVLRFCKKLGFEGYKDFRNSLVNDIARERPQKHDIKDHQDIGDLSDKQLTKHIFDFSHRLLEDTEQIFDEKECALAVRAISSARKILFIGLGTSGVSARYAFIKIFRLKIPCHFETDPVLSLMQVSTMGEGDLLFAISSSGRTMPVVKAAQLAAQRGVTVISLSDYSVSPLSTISDIKLFTTPRNAEEFRDIERPLIISQISLIDIIYSRIFRNRKDFVLSVHNVTKKAAEAEKM